MIPVSLTLGAIAAAAATAVATAQTLGAAGNFTLNGTAVTSGVAILDVQRQIALLSAANDSAITFTVTGTNSDGLPIRETVAGTNAGTAVTTLGFKTVTQVSASAATTGNVTIGTNSVAYSPWKLIDWHGAPVNISFAVVVTGTANYTVELCYEDFNASAANVMGSQTIGNYPIVPSVFAHPVLSALAASQDSTTNDPIIAWRAKLNSGTGSIKVLAVQAGLSEARW